ncbi:MAG: glycosyltransferase [Deltaproteobacteria bacterium]|nr:glycosyltransferase [Deltaproteobacteria bacterium]
MTRDVRIAIYGDVDLNIIDGSAIWLQSIASVLARQPRNHVTVVLKAAEVRDILTRPLRDIPGVQVVNPIDEGMFDGPQLSRNQALDVLETLDSEQRFDAFVFRGFHLCCSAARRKRRNFEGRMWPYLTDIPQRAEDFDEETLHQLTLIAEASRFVLCQTEGLRSFLESYVPAVAKKSVLLTPMIPDSSVPDTSAKPLADDEPLRIGYIGKNAPAWNTYEMTQVTAALRAEGVRVQLHMVGDKIHRPEGDPGFYERMKAALSDTDGVIWEGGKSRDEARAVLGEFHVALGWRDSALDESLELSTKLLEYGAAGLPVIMNRIPMHEELFGADYPLFANSQAGFSAAVRAARCPEVRQLAAKRCAAASASFSFSQVAERLQPYVDRAVPHTDLRKRPDGPLRVLVACHDFKFFTRIQEHLGAIRGVELRLDSWSTISEHDEAKSQELLDWAQVIICEWCTNNAIWYSKRKREGQRLIVRLHRFELYGQYVKKVEFENIDHMVFVGDYYRDEAKSRLGWDESKLEVIPNWVDTKLLDRPKVFGAIFNLGMIGIAPMRKRLDRGITILEKLRAVDDRFRLFIKSKMVWDYSWIWAKTEEQDHYGDVFRRINNSPLLRGAVHFDGFGPDVAAWLRKIGFVLSTSDDESFHLAPSEGMASGALPMLLPWEGARAIYPNEWVYEDEDKLVDSILRVVEEGSWERHGAEVKEFIGAQYAVERVCEAWEQLVVGSTSVKP